jgi:hypothetical protein
VEWWKDNGKKRITASQTKNHNTGLTFTVLTLSYAATFSFAKSSRMQRVTENSVNYARAREISSTGPFQPASF